MSQIGHVPRQKTASRLVPSSIAAELTSYFSSVAAGALDGDYE